MVRSLMLVSTQRACMMWIPPAITNGLGATAVTTVTERLLDLDPDVIVVLVMVNGKHGISWQIQDVRRHAKASFATNIY